MNLTSLNAVQTAVLAALTQIAGIAVAFGLLSQTREQIIVSAAGTVLASAVTVVYAVEQWKAVKLAQVSK